MSNMKAQSLPYLLLGMLGVVRWSLQSIVFSSKDGVTDGPPHLPPVVRILSAPQQGILVCLVSGLQVGPVLISWRVNTTVPGPPMRPPVPQLLWTQTHPTGNYRASSVWTLNKSDWSPSASYCCGATHGLSLFRGRVLEDLEPDSETCCHGVCLDEA